MKQNSCNVLVGGCGGGRAKELDGYIVAYFGKIGIPIGASKHREVFMPIPSLPPRSTVFYFLLPTRRESFVFGSIFEVKVLMDLDVLRSLELKNYIFGV